MENKAKNTFRGGFRLGKGLFSSLNGTYPFAKLRVEDKIYLELWFLIFKRIYVFELDEVLVKVGVLCFGESIQIIHNNPKYPSHIYFHAFKAEKIALLLKSKGVDLEEYSKTTLQKVCKKTLMIYVSIFLIVWVGGVLSFFVLIACNALGYI